MPELPEVETTVRALQEEVLKKTFVDIWTERNLERLDLLKGDRIEAIERKGKNIVFFLKSGRTLLVHLRMTGYLLLGAGLLRKRKESFLRVILFLDDERQLALSDARRFAKISLLSPEEIEELEKRLGPDPLSIEKEEFFSRIEGRKGAVKILLMDQSFLAGIGNIYAVEILFKAKVHPTRKANSLSDEEKEKIFFKMKEVLRRAISLKGDSTSDFRLLDGRKGGYQNEHLVYRREGLLCPDCQTSIKRSAIGNRGTYYCPYCQK